MQGVSHPNPVHYIHHWLMESGGYHFVHQKTNTDEWIEFYDNPIDAEAITIGKRRVSVAANSEDPTKLEVYHFFYDSVGFIVARIDFHDTNVFKTLELLLYYWINKDNYNEIERTKRANIKYTRSYG